MARLFPQRSVLAAMLMPFVWVSGLLAQEPAPAEEESTLQPLPFPEISPPMETAAVWPWWYWALGATAVLLVATVVALIIMAVRRPVAVARRPALAVALEQLAQLRGDLDSMSPSQAGHQVSVILRSFQEQIYRVPAPYRTSEELYRSGMGSLVTPDVEHRFAPLARVYDQLEFAPAPATRQEVEKLIEDAITALQQKSTIPPRLPDTARQAATPAPSSSGQI